MIANFKDNLGNFSIWISRTFSIYGDGFFDIEAKKGLRKYWVSSGHFKTEEYEAMVASDLAFYVDTENKFVDVLADQSLTRVIIEE